MALGIGIAGCMLPSSDVSWVVVLVWSAIIWSAKAATSAPTPRDLAAWLDWISNMSLLAAIIAKPRASVGIAFADAAPAVDIDASEAGSADADAPEEVDDMSPAQAARASAG